MAEKTVAQKLQIKPGITIWVEGEDLERLGELPDGVTQAERLGDADVAVLFADSAAAVRALVGAHADELVGPGILWVAYPKGNRADINRDTLWPLLGEHGMRPVSQAAVDDVWSALRFRPLKEGEEQFSGGRR